MRTNTTSANMPERGRSSAGQDEVRLRPKRCEAVCSMTSSRSPGAGGGGGVQEVRVSECGDVESEQSQKHLKKRAT